MAKKVIKYVVFYEEDDDGKDPLVTFTSKTGLKRWLKKAWGDDDFSGDMWSSIRIFEVKAEFGVKTSWELVSK